MLQRFFSRPGGQVAVQYFYSKSNGGNKVNMRHQAVLTPAQRSDLPHRSMQFQFIIFEAHWLAVFPVASSLF